MRSRPRHRVRSLVSNQSGKVSWVTMLLLLGLVAGGYWAVVYVPLFLDNMNVKSKCDEAVNKSWKYKDAELTRERFLQEVHRLGKIKVDVGGVMEDRPMIDPKPDDLLVEVDESVPPGTLTIDVTYSRVVTLPLLDREKEFWFSTSCSQTLEAVAY